MEEPVRMADAAAELSGRTAVLTAEEFIDACHAFRAQWGTLPTSLAGLRREKLREIRHRAEHNGQVLGWLARRLGFTPDRFRRLSRPAVRTEATA